MMKFESLEDKYEGACVKFGTSIMSFITSHDPDSFIYKYVEKHGKILYETISNNAEKNRKIFFVYGGILHYVDTEWFEPIVPPWLSFPTFWVILSGIFEIGVGFGLLISKTRRNAALASALLLIAGYPANIYMWIYNVELGDGTTLTQIGHVYRLCAQIAGVLACIWIYKTTPLSGMMRPSSQSTGT